MSVAVIDQKTKLGPIASLSVLFRIPRIRPFAIFIPFSHGETRDPEVFSDILNDQGAESAVQNERNEE